MAGMDRRSLPGQNSCAMPLGVQATIGNIRNTFTGPWLDAQQI